MKKKKGFTLVELVIVIAVIAVLAAVLVPTFITVINSANDSADTQLVANMNTVLSTEVYADETATAENLRKLLKDNGITDLSTKNKDNIIAYNQAKNRFEKINLKNTAINTEASVSGPAFMDGPVNPAEGLVIDPDPFSFAEIFKGYTIVSTGGNEFAEAVYGFYSTRFDTSSTDNSISNSLKTLWDKVLSININNKEAVIAGFRNLLNKSVFIDFFEHVQGSRVRGFYGVVFVYINEENVLSRMAVINNNFASCGTPDRINDGRNLADWSDNLWADSDKKDDRGILYISSNKIQITPARVFIPETTPELNLYVLTDFGGAVVVLPNSLETVRIPETISDLSNIMFLGNTNVLYDAVGVDTAKLRSAQISSQHIQEIKESVKKFGAAVAQSEYYVVNSEHANKNKPHYYTELEVALQAAGDSADATGLPRQVIIASDYTIDSGDIAIPQNVTLHVPYSLDGNIKNNLGSGTEGAQKTLVDDELKTESNTDYTYNSGYKKCTLTISSGASLTVNGTLEVGAEMNSGLMTDSDVAYYNCVNGNYGQITNSGTITVAPGGRLNAYGYVKCKESGKVVVNDGATVYDPIVITDMTSVDTLVSLIFTNNKFPYMRYALPNITKLEVNYGGLLSVMNFSVAMGSGESLIDSEGYFVGSDKNPAADGSLPYGGLLTLCNSANGQAAGSVLIEYEYKNAVKDPNTSNNLAGDIGINTVTLNGNVKTGIVMSLGADIQKRILSYIPYNFNYIISNNCTFSVTNKYAVLPGAQITVDGGTLSVVNGGEFYVTDKYNDSQNLSIDGKSYPTQDMLQAAELETYGVVTLKNGATFEAKAGAKVGGTLQVEGTVTFKIEENSNLTGNFTVGADVGDGNSNAQTYTLPLSYKKKGGETSTQLQTGTTKV